MIERKNDSVFFFFSSPEKLFSLTYATELFTITVSNQSFVVCLVSVLLSIGPGPGSYHWARHRLGRLKRLIHVSFTSGTRDRGRQLH